MSKNPSHANQDHYKVAGSDQRPTEHAMEKQKRDLKLEKEAIAKPVPGSKDAEPGKKATPAKH